MIRKYLRTWEIIAWLMAWVGLVVDIVMNKAMTFSQPSLWQAMVPPIVFGLGIFALRLKRGSMRVRPLNWEVGAGLGVLAISILGIIFAPTLWPFWQSVVVCLAAIGVLHQKRRWYQFNLAKAA